MRDTCWPNLKLEFDDLKDLNLNIGFLERD